MNGATIVIEPCPIPRRNRKPAAQPETDAGLSEVEKNWNEFGKRDPLWAILTDESKRDNKWNLVEFFATGEREIGGVLRDIEKLNHSFTRGKALDFGCGVGRLTQALCRHFEECHGIDIAESMVEKAREYNRYGARCHYHVNTRPDLSLFADNTFDFVYTNIVLQHNPPAMARRFIQEFLRILKPGGLLMFQLPSEPLQALGGEGTPLKAAAFCARLTLAGGDLQLLAGTTRKISVTVKNLSPETWPGKAVSGKLGIRLGNHWRDAKNRVIINDDARADLPHDLKSGEEITLALNVSVPSVPGQYRLELDMVQEAVAWFADKKSPTLMLDVEVAPNQQLKTPTKPDAVGELDNWFAGKTGEAGVAASRPASETAAEPAPAKSEVLVPRMDMNGIPKPQMLAFLAANGAKTLQVADDTSATGWVSYRYCVTKGSSSTIQISDANPRSASVPGPGNDQSSANAPLPAGSPAAKNEISEPLCQSCEQFLARYAGAGHPQFLTAAYDFIFQRGLDEAGYNNHLIKLYAGLDRKELLREFIRSEEFQKLQAHDGFRLAEVQPAAPATPLPPRSSLEQYQDIWVKGGVHRRGVRECEDRFALISKFCAQFQRPFTILDIGSNLGYFSLRLTEAFDCTSVAVEGIYGDWIEEVFKLNENPRVILLKKIIKLADLRALAEVEHFDVVLGLSVIHHLDGRFDESLEVLRSLGDHVILELPFEANACGQQIVQEAVTAKLPDDAVFMGFGKSHLAEGQRQIVSLSRPKIRIAKSYLGTPRKDLSLTIHSNFSEKRVEFHNKPETRPWLRGINLQTYLWLNGAYPPKPQIAEALKHTIAQAKQHRDIQPWNVVLQGATVELIDRDDPNHAFAYEDHEYLNRLLLLLRAESLGHAAFGALERIKFRPRLGLPVRWRGPIFNPSGYASEAINFLLPLSEQVDLGIFHLNNTYSEKFVAGLSAANRDRLFTLRDRYEEFKSGIVIEHNPANGFTLVPDAAYRIGRTMFETDRISPDWVSKCNQMDEIWVPSKFNVETFAASGVERDKLFVMPESVDENEFNPDQTEALVLPHRAAFNFLSIFEWSRRKGWDVLLSAYFREFSAADDICLYLRTYLFSKPDGDPTTAIQRLINEHAATLNLGNKPLPRVHIIAEQVPQAKLPGLYKAADCLVAPSRGEGWGRPHHEAMFMGLPVIATNWSGNTEFMTPDNSYLIDYEMADTTALEPELRHYRGHRWADPSEKSLRAAMRRVQQNPAEARAKGQRARQEMLRGYSRPPVTDLLVARLQEIERKLVTPVCPAVTARASSPPPTQPNVLPTVASAATFPPIVNRKSQIANSSAVRGEQVQNVPIKRLRITWEGSFLDLGSLSHVNRELTHALSSDSRHEVTRLGNNTLAPALAGHNDLKNLSRRVQSQPPRQADVTVRHEWPPKWERPAAGAWVLIQPWEFGVLPAEWTQRLAAVDEIWAPTDYVRRVYVESGIHPSKVKIVPNGIDPQKFRPDVPPLKLATNKQFKFLFVGGTIHRKGADILIQSYLKTFTAADDVCLVIKDFGGQSVYQGQTLAKEIAAAQLRPNSPEILYLTNEFAAEEMSGLYTACQCLLHPYRGEGFGLPVLEAMACGLPVVVTGGGATDDFATDEFAYRVPALKKKIGDTVGGMKLHTNGWWLEPDAAAFADRMKWIFTNRESARNVGLAASAHVRANWTWARAARIAERRLQDLTARKQTQTAALAERRARKAGPMVLPETAKAGYLGAARELFAKKDLIAAWNSTLAALAARPFHCEAYLLLAEIAKGAGDFAQAKICAERARQLAPDWKPAKQFTKGLLPNGYAREWPALPAVAKPRLSVCLITRNEERFLGKCLQSIRELAHQIVVVDTGSTDATVEIAHQFQAEVHRFPWNDDFSAARNEALKYATGDWVLCLDADEELLPQQLDTLRQEMLEASVMAYRLPIIDEGREQEGCSYVPRLFRNAPGLFFVGRVHEQVFTSILVRSEEWGLKNVLGKSTLLHHGYTKELIVSRDKIARNLRLLELAMEELPNEPNLLMSYGMELARSGQLEAGLEHYIEALHLMSNLPPSQVVPELRETLLTQLSTHLMAAKAFGEIVRLWNSAFAKSAGITASQHFILGLAQMELKQFAEAAEHMRQCISKRNQPVLSPINQEILKAGPSHCLAICLSTLDQKAAAEQAFLAALKDDPASRAARFDFAKFQAQQNQPVEALKLLTALVQEKAGEFQPWELGGQIALSQPEFLEFARNWTSEAIGHFPKNPAIALQRAEVLLLSQQVDDALPLWVQAHSAKSARHLAALALCEFIAGGCERQFRPADEKIVSQEFLKWYRQLIKSGASSVVNQINERLDDLNVCLPTAVSVLGAALKKAGEALVPQPC